MCATICGCFCRIQERLREILLSAVLRQTRSSCSPFRNSTRNPDHLQISRCLCRGPGNYTRASRKTSSLHPRQAVQAFNLSLSWLLNGGMEGPPLPTHVCKLDAGTRPALGPLINLRLSRASGRFALDGAAIADNCTKLEHGRSEPAGSVPTHHPR